MNHLSLLVEQRRQVLMQDAQHERLVRQVRAARRTSSTPLYQSVWAVLQGIIHRQNRRIEGTQPNIIPTAALEIKPS